VQNIFEKRIYWMLVVIAALIFGMGWGQIDVASVQGQPVSGDMGGGALITHFYDDPNGGPTRVIVVDPQQKRIAVYHVPVASGAIQLKSVRNITVDLQAQEINSPDFSPINQKKMLDRN